MSLTQARARRRTALIKKGSASYDYHVSFDEGEEFTILAEIHFELLNVPTDELTIDLSTRKVHKVVQNGALIATNLSEEGFVHLDIAQLKAGPNKVALLYTAPYSNDGNGCVSFVDVDTKRYLYTQFQAYYANRMIACFDQPDIKAKFRLGVVAPKSLGKVLSNENPIAAGDFTVEAYQGKAHTAHPELLKEFLSARKEGSMFSIFGETPMLPTYLVCLVAGPYVQMKHPQGYNGIPMSLFCIESLYPQMERLSEFIFQITIESMKFFEPFFGYKFPFSKYDQVFAHEYKWGAMENAGIVTFNDHYLFKDKVSTDRMLNFANTISHELSHHWFGNLVTMKWWDDLWLNESFADFISHYCLQKIKNNVKTIHYESAMAQFLVRGGWAYREDQLVTTHPIRGPVANTAVAESIFDGITYSKGAATMNQLLFLVGQESFSKSLSAHFHKYAWDNADLDQFLASITANCKVEGVNLQQWKALWLETASLNFLEPHWNPQDVSPQAKLVIHQTPYTAKYPTLRPHKMKVALFKEDLSYDTLQVFVKPQTETTIHYDGSKGYTALLLNCENNTFAKIIIDAKSLDFLCANISKITGLLPKSIIWRSLYEMVKDAKITSRKHSEIVLKAIEHEVSDSVFENQFTFVKNSISTFTPIPHREALRNELFDFVLGLLKKSKDYPENRRISLRCCISDLAFGEKNIRVLIDWFDNKIPDLAHCPPGISERWTIVSRSFTLPSIPKEEKERLFAAVEALDKTDTPKNMRLYCDALIASKEQFEKGYNSLLDKDSKMSVQNKNYIIRGLNNRVHEALLGELVPRYFADIEKAAMTLTQDHALTFIEGFEPIGDDLSLYIQKYSQIKLPPGKLDKISTELLKMVDDLERRKRAYHLFEPKL